MTETTDERTGQMTIDTATADELRAIAARGAEELEGASTQELLRWTTPI